MPRGIRSKVGDTRITQNGYHQTRVVNGWKYTARIKMEEHLGRTLDDSEWVRFRDGDKSNLDIENLYVGEIVKKPKAVELTEIEVLRQEIDELKAKIINSRE